MKSLLKMKFLLTAIFLLLYSSLQSQSEKKHDYMPHQKYNDTLIHTILNPAPIHRSNYKLAGKVKSMFIKTTNEEKNKVKYSKKYFYNKDKRIERIIEYGETINDIELDKKYYRFGDHYSPLVVKEGFAKSGEVQFYSEIDNNQNLIIVKEMKNGQLKKLDSIYYIDDYRPVYRKRYSAENKLVESEKIEYDENKVVLNISIKNITNRSGLAFVFDKKNRIYNSIRLKGAKLEPFQYELGDTTKLFEWTPDGFIYYNRAWKDTVIYNAKLSNVLINKNRGSKEIFKLSKDLKPITKETYISTPYPTPIINQFLYNENGELISNIRSCKGFKRYERDLTYTYEYDHYKNWIVRKQYLDNELYKTEERFIEYYE